jgi:hypothetical protein
MHSGREGRLMSEMSMPMTDAKRMYAFDEVWNRAA